MIENTYVLQTKTYDPWWNLAVEEYLLDRVEQNECILYLWQNQNTVVIGKNQNPWKECRTELLEKEGGKLARRLSGGGAVFHDLGNLNFTFILNRENYNLEKQVKVILSAVNSLGIAAEMSGRNDLTVEGRKFSGNAFCFRKNNAYHHGTILISADMSKLSRYLQVPQEKMRSKGVESVRSRVVNLDQYVPGLTVNEVSKALIDAFADIYQNDPVILFSVDNMEHDSLQKLYEKYSSWEWRYGEAPKFDMELTARFAWGGVDIGLHLERGRVKEAAVYSDSMDEEFIGMLPQVLSGSSFSSKDLSERIRSLDANGERCTMINDIADWLMNKEF